MRALLPSPACGLVILAALLATGCRVLVPQTRLALDLQRQRLHFSSPKDIALTNLVVRVETNGTFSASVSSLSSTNSAAVIHATGEGQAKTLQATGEVIQKSGEAAGVVGQGVIQGIKGL